MNNTPFEFTRLEKGQRKHTQSLTQAVGSKNAKQDRWLFVSPHDDDACLGAGLWIQAALASGAGVDLLVVTDGRMGYCHSENRNTIIETRRMETYASCASLGVDQQHVHYIDYPDGALVSLQGRQAKHERPDIDDIRGYVGLQNAMTYYLRSIDPTRIVVPTSTDLHPDHRITHSELMISLFHASGTIWPELGPPIKQIPRVYEMAVYCDFGQPPNLRVRAGQRAFERKLASIAAFRSQDQIAQLVQNVRTGGPIEHLCELDFHFYKPSTYDSLFEEPSR